MMEITLGINYDAAETTYAEHNSLYTEINWFYPKAGIQLKLIDV
jgi:hypothetical protein